MRINNKFQFDNSYFDEPIILNNFAIYQIGDILCEPNALIDNHFQKMSIEISFIESGSGTFYTNNIPTSVSGGQIYLSFEKDIHKIVADTSLRFFYLALNVEKTSRYFDIVQEIATKYSNENNRIVDLPYVFPQMTNILSEIAQKNASYYEIIESNLMQIIIYLQRASKKQIISLNSYKIDFKKGMVYNIINYIDNYTLSIKNLNELAEEFSYDYSYMSKTFREQMGITIHDYLQKKKLVRAKMLLSKEKKSITKTAELLNYSSIHNFSRAFKNYYGISPQEYKDSNEIQDLY